jgi:hypothetical protein
MVFGGYGLCGNALEQREFRACAGVAAKQGVTTALRRGKGALNPDFST